MGGSPTYVVLLNMGSNVESFDLSSIFFELSSQLQYVVVTDTSPRRKGDFVNSNSVVLMPKEAVVLKTV